MPDSTPNPPQQLENEKPANDVLSSPPMTSDGVDLNWVWREVRKRVFIKLPFSLGVADAMEAVVPITLTDEAFVCGLASRDYGLSGHLQAAQVRNTIENILRQAARRQIRFELIEGTSASDWQALQERQQRAHSAVVAMAEKNIEEHHYDDILNQVVSEMRRRITSTPDRMLPPVRAHLLLELVPQLADIEEMLFAEQESHERRRSMARAIDRIASFLDVPPFTLALEIERLRIFEIKAKPEQIVGGARVLGDSESTGIAAMYSLSTPSIRDSSAPDSVVSQTHAQEPPTGDQAHNEPVAS